MAELRQLIEEAGEDLLFYKIRNGKLVEYQLSDNVSEELKKEFENVMNEVDEIAQLKIIQAEQFESILELLGGM